MKTKIDLHIHSTASDGLLSPRELIDLAIKRGLKAIAITDHDSLGGLKEAEEYSKGKNIEFVPGIEFSANPGGLAKETHIVGLFLDYNHKGIKELVSRQKEYRRASIRQLINNLNRLGYEITFDETAKEANKDTFGRPEIAKTLLRKYPQFKNIKQIFDELLGQDGKAFIMSKSSSKKEIIDSIHEAKGLAILAHPGYLFENSEQVIEEFVKLGGDGIEVECPYDSFGKDASNLRKKFRKMAKDNQLFISGGTDFHEEKNMISLGSFGITLSEFKKLKQAKRENL